jgi:hypothetical protein
MTIEGLRLGSTGESMISCNHAGRSGAGRKSIRWPMPWNGDGAVSLERGSVTCSNARNSVRPRQFTSLMSGHVAAAHRAALQGLLKLSTPIRRPGRPQLAGEFWGIQVNPTESNHAMAANNGARLCRRPAAATPATQCDLANLQALCLAMLLRLTEPRSWGCSNYRPLSGVQGVLDRPLNSGESR